MPYVSLRGNFRLLAVGKTNHQHTKVVNITSKRDLIFTSYSNDSSKQLKIALSEGFIQLARSHSFDSHEVNRSTSKIVGRCTKKF